MELATRPLVSILIPAYNAEATIAETLRSAIDQTWSRKEIIVIDDGSTDRTTEVARGYASEGVRVVSTENRGMCAALNLAYSLCEGDYIQELDADDILAADKIERQFAALQPRDSKRMLLSSAWAPFFHRTRTSRFIKNSLCQDLSPVEWLLRKMTQNGHMQNATWLMSRELAFAAGPWDTRLHYDQDGEYFARVVRASEGIRFVPGTGVFYRASGPGSISHLGNSDRKKESLLLSMKLHIEYLQSLEDSDRIRRACLQYMQNWYGAFYPSRRDLAAELQTLASQFDGHLKVPRLKWKYAWLEPFIGLDKAKRTQDKICELKSSCMRRIDKALWKLEPARRSSRGVRLSGA